MGLLDLLIEADSDLPRVGVRDLEGVRVGVLVRLLSAVLVGVFVGLRVGVSVEGDKDTLGYTDDVGDGLGDPVCDTLEDPVSDELDVNVIKGV